MTTTCRATEINLWDVIEFQRNDLLFGRKMRNEFIKTHSTRFAATEALRVTRQRMECVRFIAALQRAVLNTPA